MKAFAPLVILAVLLLFPYAASACVCDTLATVEKAFSEASAIFSARYVGSEYRKGIKNDFAEMDAADKGKKADYETLVYRFEVTEWWKGGDKKEMILATDHLRMADGSEVISDCGLGFETGRSYLIYAYAEGSEHYTGVCTRTRSMKRAAGDLRALRKLRSK